ncbi:low affinity iron permease family protein [Candidatus Peribacteria bacterium]|nr:MAG: low affinity iron permease family protein [Candidatus Peribacteria bacterium]
MEYTSPHSKSLFAKFAKWIASAAGHPIAFFFAIALICIWASVGHIFNFSNTWQLVVNTGTTIVTFLMVFLIQNTQNRDSIAMQIKLDELIRAGANSHNAVIDVEELTEKELNALRLKYEDMAEKARAHLQKRKKTTVKRKK